MVHQGPKPNIDKDPILLECCDTLDDGRTQGWTAPFKFLTLGAAGGGCVGLKQGTAEKGDRLLLRTITTNDSTIQWTKDDEGRFLSKIDTAMCMQAGHRNSATEGGIKIRMVKCGFSDHQKFDISEVVNDDDGLSGLIRTAGTPKLCMVHRTIIVDIDSDPIFLRLCDNLEGDRAEGWEVTML